VGRDKHRETRNGLTTKGGGGGGREFQTVKNCLFERMEKKVTEVHGDVCRKSEGPKERYDERKRGNQEG